MTCARSQISDALENDSVNAFLPAKLRREHEDWRTQGRDWTKGQLTRLCALLRIDMSFQKCDFWYSKGVLI